MIDPATPQIQQEPATPDVSTAPPAQPAPPLRHRILRRVGWGAIWGLVVVAGLWAVAAVALGDLDGGRPRIVQPILFALVTGAVLIAVRPRGRALLIACMLVGGVFLWYLSIRPSNDRVWPPEFARLATATIDGDQITIHNYRDLAPDTDDALRQQYIDQTFDLNDLRRADLIMSYWGPKRIAHALVSFEFADGRYAAMSIEVRRRASQARFSMLSSLFRNYELIYVVGSEKALIGPGILDDHHRLFLYRTNISPERSRALFLRYAHKLNELAARPEWYNAVTDNCTTGIYLHLRECPDPPPFSITILVNGYLPEYVYRQGSLGTDLPWEELNRRCDIKLAGQQAFDFPDFSTRIRANVPLPAQPHRSSAGVSPSN